MTNSQKTPADARIADFEQTMGVRLYQTEVVTPCQTVDPRRSPSGRDLWFSPFKDKVHAVRACQECPFIGRCGYNAVAGRETHGVWGGIALPGIHGHVEDLEAAYVVLLRQFKRRMPIELPNLAEPSMPSTSVRRRRNGDPAAA